jgi:hypothetical protein
MHTDPGHASLAALRSFLEDLENTAAVAATLLRQGHRIDLTGLDAQVGLLCAKALDLPMQQGRDIRADLLRLHGTMARLEGGLAACGRSRPGDP